MTSADYGTKLSGKSRCPRSDGSAGARLNTDTVFGCVVAAPLCRGASRTATERRGYIFPASNGGSDEMHTIDWNVAGNAIVFDP